MNHELPDVQDGFRKGRGTRDQIANKMPIAGSSKKQESSRKKSISALLTMPEPLTVWTTSLWKILQKIGIPAHLTFLFTKKDLHDQDNHNGVTTHLEPDILECEVKWALESISMKKASVGEEFQWSYFKS